MAAVARPATFRWPFPVPLAKGQPAEGYPVALVRVPLARPARTRPSSASPTRACKRRRDSGAVRRRPAADRPRGRAACGQRNFFRGAPLRDADTRDSDRRPAWIARRRCGYRCVGRGPRGSRVDGPPVWLHGDLIPGTCWPSTAGSAPSSTSGVSAWATPPATCWSRGTSFPRDAAERLPRRPARRRRDLGARSRLGTLHRPDPTPVLSEHQPCARGCRPTHRSLRCSPITSAPDDNSASVSATDEIEIRRLGATEVRERTPASGCPPRLCFRRMRPVSYIAPFSREDARSAFEGFRSPRPRRATGFFSLPSSAATWSAPCR